jgi:hypothetical protein
MSGHLPDRVWIGGVRRPVIIQDPDIAQGRLEYDDWDIRKGKLPKGSKVGRITICPSLHKDIIEQHETLFHEMLHAAEIATGRHIGEVSVEKIGKVLFRGLLSSGLYNLAPDTSQLELPMWEDQ